MIAMDVTYSKKLGLPQYSSHQYSVSVRTEISDLSQVESASAELYQQLQEAVDRDIQNPGFLPGDEGKSRQVVPFNRGGASTPSTASSNVAHTSTWNCSEKQQGLIEKLMAEHKIPFTELDELSHHRFNCGLKQLNKMSASGLIDELFASYRKQPKGRSSASGSYQGGRR